MTRFTFHDEDSAPQAARPAMDQAKQSSFS